LLGSSLNENCLLEAYKSLGAMFFPQPALPELFDFALLWPKFNIDPAAIPVVN
jgi:hypothetical protein